VGCDVFPSDGSNVSSAFQSTHPRGVRLRGEGSSCGMGCFNPRTHVGCDCVSHFERLVRCVSIHAPTWGATCVCVESSFADDVSIHAPTWGATELPCFLHGGFKVSIHAPTWGATIRLSSLTLFVSAFQSTHPRGVRLEDLLRADNSIMFQSTHPRGVRPIERDCYNAIRMFQSTHPRGVRRSFRVSSMEGSRFQSTHPRGVRHRRPCCNRLGYGVSIHAPTWGATLSALWIPDSQSVSIHAPTWGAT